MDDQELEGRLRAHLHARLDDARPSPELAATVRGRLVTEPLLHPGLRFRRPRTLRLGLSLAAVAALVVLAVGGGLARLPGFGGRPSSPTPSASASSRFFMVLPPTSAVPAKATTEATMEILGSRLRALGVGTFAGAAGDAIQYEVPPGGPSDDAIRQVLAAPGAVTFVPVRDPDFGDGGPAPVVGQPLPEPKPSPLFGGEVRVIVERSSSGTGESLSLDLTAADAPTFATFSATHVGQQLAILVDDIVAVVAIIQSPITDGRLVISTPSPTGGSVDPTWAILLSGPLPGEWRNAVAVVAVGRDAAERSALQEGGPGSTVRSSGLQPLWLGIGRWTATWAVELSGSFPGTCAGSPFGSPGPISPCPSLADSELVVLDAQTGGFISSEAPAP